MDTLRAIIENWPKTKHFLEYFPIIFAIIALAVVLYRVCLTRQSFIASHRPYVWASTYGVYDPEKKTIIPIPFRVAYRERNSRAKIARTKVKINLNVKPLLIQTEEDIIRFLEGRSERSFSIGEEDFKIIKNRSNENEQGGETFSGFISKSFCCASYPQRWALKNHLDRR